MMGGEFRRTREKRLDHYVFLVCGAFAGRQTIMQKYLLTDIGLLNINWINYKHCIERGVTLHP